MKRPILAAAGIGLVLMVSACAPSDAPAESKPPTLPTTTQAAPTPVETDVAPDPTSKVQAVAGDHVVAATEDYPGEFVVETDIVDPRTGSGSSEALEAIAICEAIQSELGATNVRVQEADGTTFVVLGGTFKECTEA